MTTANAPSAAPNFGSKLRSLRKDAGLSLRQTAKMAGISSTFLADVEFGRRMPARAIIGRLADAIGAKVDELLVLDPREGIDDIMATASADPAARAVLAKLCRCLGSGTISTRDLERMLRRGN